jgi:hypothetical protein
MATAAPAIAAAVAAAQRRIAARFTDEGATSPAAAIAPFEPERHIERKVLARLRKNGVVCEAAEGRLWLDEEKLATYMAKRRRRALTMIVGVIAAAAVVAGIAAVSA